MDKVLEKFVNMCEIVIDARGHCPARGTIYEILEEDGYSFTDIRTIALLIKSHNWDVGEAYVHARTYLAEAKRIKGE